ncbi:MAG: alpha/beta fold hydrolase [Rhodospirillaceae bacterium]|jgi:pimeloyl-ACP methyl ester carboxylesterase|nr:alpha/beta fold hydrolase [Rhodospirillaceae bacterium]MBT5811277.1 alpha/beta fold hydrolase [Rhodospirillaceae bacterium]
MPILKRDDAEIYYETYGSGHTILLFAPGGMRSRMELWRAPDGGPPRPWHDWIEVLSRDYRVVAMDQRNAGQSRGDVAADHGWHTYAGDHLALMDHLGAEKFHTLGGCIGGSFCLKLCEMAPERVTAAVLQNPIGLHPVETTYFPDSFAEWAEEQRAIRSDLDDKALESFCQNMFDGDFVFCVDRDFARRCPTPTLVLPGDDVPHPAVTGQELIELLPGTEYLNDWKGPAHIDEQRDVVLAFLAKHTA